MSYVDAFFDRDSDIIRVVERKDGKRDFREYQAKYTFYYKDERGKYKSVYGDPLTRIVCKNTKDFRKEVAINKDKKLFESDINPIFQCLSENYLNQDAPKLNIAFFDIETDFDPERGFADPSDPFMPITSISVYLQWLETMVCLAVPPKTLTMEQAKKELEGIDNVMLFEKEGDMIDTFLMLGGEDHGRFRMLRSVKNRFGAVNELGIFAMMETGMLDVENPSAIFLSRGEASAPGSQVMAIWEGTRPLLVEAQALVDESMQSNPRRIAVGFESQRLAMLLAVLHRHGGLQLGDQDVYLNAVGGVRVEETSSDLAVLLAVISSAKNRTLPSDLICFGEIGLSGEVRPVSYGPERLREAVKHGFKRALVPKANLPKEQIGEMNIHPVQHLSDAMKLIQDWI